MIKSRVGVSKETVVDKNSFNFYNVEKIEKVRIKALHPILQCLFLFFQRSITYIILLE